MYILVLNAPFLPKFSRAQRSPAVTKSGTLYYPIWLAYAAGVLEDAGFGVTLLDAPAKGLDLADVERLAAERRPGLVVMDAATPSIHNDHAVAARIKQAAPGTVVVFTGTHVSALPAESLGPDSAVDAVARREYDYTVRDLAQAVDRAGGLPGPEELRTIPGLSFRAAGEVVHNPDRPFIEDLDELPWVSRVYRRHLDYRHYFNPNALYPMVTLISSRGCPFRCSFCVYPQTLTGRAYRFRSIPDIVDEMEYCREVFPGMRSFFFEDDTLTANKKRCVAFSRAVIERGLRVPWTANSRVDLDLETMRLMRQAGCRMLCVGFESGDPEALKAMRKGVTRERMKQFMADARKAGILIHGCFIFGFPGETRSSVERTIDFAIELSPDTAQFYPVMVYPGTEAYDDYLTKGWITAQDFSRWLTPEGLHNCVVRNEALAPEELVRLCDEARRRFYLRPGYMAYKLRQSVRNPAELVRTAKAARTFFKHLMRGSKV